MVQLRSNTIVKNLACTLPFGSVNYNRNLRVIINRIQTINGLCNDTLEFLVPISQNLQLSLFRFFLNGRIQGATLDFAREQIAFDLNIYILITHP
jgi:hypothetical protein